VSARLQFNPVGWIGETGSLLWRRQPIHKALNGGVCAPPDLGDGKKQDQEKAHESKKANRLWTEHGVLNLTLGAYPELLRGVRIALFDGCQDARPRSRWPRITAGTHVFKRIRGPKRMVVLDTAGKRFVKASAEERQEIWRGQLLHLRLFREIYELLQRQPDHSIDQDFLLETIVLNMPHENYETVFQTFIRWARFGNLFAYDEANGTISLQ
jgi:C-terminal AAA-associated domain